MHAGGGENTVVKGPSSVRVSSGLVGILVGFWPGGAGSAGGLSSFVPRYDDLCVRKHLGYSVPDGNQVGTRSSKDTVMNELAHGCRKSILERRILQCFAKVILQRHDRLRRLARHTFNHNGKIGDPSTGQVQDKGVRERDLQCDCGGASPFCRRF